MIYEMRTYVPVKGRSAEMRTRFTTHVAQEFFPRHGIELVAAFVPQDATDERLVYITRFSNEDARAAAWQAFSSDAGWKAVKAASEVNGPLLESQDVQVLTPAMTSLLLA